MHRATSFWNRQSFVRLVCALGIPLFAATGMPAYAAAVTVNVDGRPLYLNPGPIERVGRVFVPLRGIFERLGASVVYQNREINSTKGNTSVSLRIGSKQATVNGQPQIIDVAPFIVGATTYVPLRFVAQSLGATVDYNGATRLVAIRSPRQPRPPMPPMPPNPPPVSYVDVGARQPSPNSQSGNRFAPIGAEFSEPVDPNTVRVWLDDNDITSRSNVSRSGFNYKPPAPLNFGTHYVRVEGVDRQGRRFENSWSFFTSQSAPPPPASRVQLRDQKPSPGSTVSDRNAVIGANFVPLADGASVRVRLDSEDITWRSGVTQSGFSFRPSEALDFGTHTVQVSGRGRTGVPFDHSWSFTTNRPTPETPVELRNQQPSPGATVDNRFAQISANFVPQANGASVRVRLDGNDTTGRSGVSASGFSYKPPAPLSFGTHTIQVSGRARGGLEFQHSWSFTVRHQEPTPISLSINTPNENEQVGRQFTVQGSTVANGRVNVTAGASESGTGQYNGNTTAGPQGNFHINVSLSPLVGQQTVTIKVTASNPSSSQTAHKSLQLRLKNAAPLPTPTPVVTTKPLPPPRPRPTPIPEPTLAPALPPTPAPTQRPRPTPVRPPTPAPTAAPTPTPTPAPARTRPLKAAPAASPTATPT